MSDLESDRVFLEVLRRLEAGSRQFPSYETLVFVLNEYLRKVYGMNRVLGRARGADEDDPVLDALTPVLRDRWGDILQLNKSRVWEVAGNNRLREDIEFVFDQLLVGLRLEPKREGQARPKSPVAVAKLLAVLAPNLCIIWDQRYVLQRGLIRQSVAPFDNPWYPSGDGLSYAHYIEEKGLQFSTLASGLKIAVKQLSEDVTTFHSHGLARLRPELGENPSEPLTKILDEVNFLPG
jgi:hypothetical protein